MFSYSGEGLPLNMPPPTSINKLNVQPNNMHAHMGHYMASEPSSGLHGPINMTAAMNPFNNFHTQRSPFPYSSLAPTMLRDAPNFMRENPSLLREPSNLSREVPRDASRDLISVKDLSTAMSASSSANNFSMFDERFRPEDFERLDRSRSLLNIPQVNPRLSKNSDDKLRLHDQNGAKYPTYEQCLPPYFDIKPDFVPDSRDLQTRNLSMFDQQKHFIKHYESPEKFHKNVPNDTTMRNDIKKFDSTDSDHNFVSKSADIIDARFSAENCIKIEQEHGSNSKIISTSNINSRYEEHLSASFPMECDSTVLTKHEESWTDTDYLKPFLKDVNGFTKEQFDLSRFTVIEAVLSCSAAIEAIKGQSSIDNQTRVYECLHCGLLFRHPKRFLVHFRWHTYGRTNEKRRLMNEEKETRRLARKKAPEKQCLEEGPLSVQCDFCDRAYLNRQRLITHRHKAHPDLPRLCRACDGEFPTDGELKAHTRAAHTEDPRTDEAKFMCDECPKTFKYMHSLLRHQPIHAEKRFACKDCDKKFGSQLLLNIHGKTHAKVASYRCSYCGKGYYHAYNLSVHERGHRGERPFQCEVCRSTYATNSSLKRHMRVSHNTSKPYECGVCHRSFATEQVRERHALRQHGGGARAGPRRRRRRARRPEDDGMRGDDK